MRTVFRPQVILQAAWRVLLLPMLGRQKTCWVDRNLLTYIVEVGAMAHKLDPHIHAEAAQLLKALRRLHYSPIASTFSATSFGNWWVNLDGPLGKLILVKDRSTYSIEVNGCVLEPLELRKDFSSLAELQDVLLAWLRNPNL
jgi:hypothetical protein